MIPKKWRTGETGKREWQHEGYTIELASITGDWGYISRSQEPYKTSCRTVFPGTEDKSIEFSVPFLFCSEVAAQVWTLFYPGFAWVREVASTRSHLKPARNCMHSCGENWSQRICSDPIRGDWYNPLLLHSDLLCPLLSPLLWSSSKWWPDAVSAGTLLQEASAAGPKAFTDIYHLRPLPPMLDFSHFWPGLKLPGTTLASKAWLELSGFYSWQFRALLLALLGSDYSNCLLIIIALNGHTKAWSSEFTVFKTYSFLPPLFSSSSAPHSNQS